MDQKEKEGFIEIKKMVTDIPCLAHFARDRDNIVTTNASSTGLGITLWQKQTDNTIQTIPFASGYLNKAEKKYLIGELEILAVGWGLKKMCFYLYGKVVYIYTNHQASELLIKRNRENWQ